MIMNIFIRFLNSMILFASGFRHIQWHHLLATSYSFIELMISAISSGSFNFTIYYLHYDYGLFSVIPAIRLFAVDLYNVVAHQPAGRGEVCFRIPVPAHGSVSVKCCR